MPTDAYPSSLEIGSDHVAPLLPATADPPEATCRINFFIAFFLFWLMPRRFGPHLSAGTFRRALQANGLTMLLLLVMAAGAFALKLCEDDIPAGLRERLASYIVRAAEENKLHIELFDPVGLVLAGIVILQVLLPLMAILSMPWCVGGDRTVSVFRRSLKNVYWTTTVIAVCAPIHFGCLVIEDEWPPSLMISSETPGMLLGIASIVVPALLLLRAWIVGASRYVGEPDGPAFRPREPQCDACGYLIVGLPVASNCPECGARVLDSLPGGKRRSTEWEQYQFSARGMRELIRVHGLVLRDAAGFFRRLPVHSGLSAARHFWWASFLIMLLTLLVLVRAGHLFTTDSMHLSQLSAVGLLAIGIPFLFQSLTMFAACLWAQLRLGLRDYRVSATVCYYACPLMWPFVVVLILTMMAFTMPELGERVFDWFARDPDDWAAAGLIVVILLGLVGYLLPLWFWWSRLARALRAVRYANV